MKIVIADDEYYVRVSLVKMLEEILLGEYEIIEVENGLQVLEIVREVQPDVVFLDIRMPRMDGLEAFEQAYALSPETQWIVISGYAEFDYARKALQLGAVDYLLKPVSQEKLEQITVDVKKRKFEQLQARNRTFKQDITSFFNRTLNLDDLPVEHALKQYSFLPVLFTLDTYVEANRRSTELVSFCADLEKITFQLNSEGLRTALVILPNGLISIILGWNRGNEESVQWVIQSCFSKINDVIAQFGGRELIFYGVTGEPCGDLSGLEEQIMAIETALPMRMLYPNKHLLRLKELASTINTVKSEVKDCCEALVELAYAYDKKDYYRYVMLSRRLETLMNRCYDSLTESAKSNIGTFLYHVLSGEANKFLAQLQDMGMWKTLVKNGEQAILSEPESGTELIDRVVEFIENHYAEDIGVGAVAGIFNITPNYLSSLFHKKTGSTFVKYVTYLRIVKAKELLAGRDVQVQEVAAAVGFNSPKHFAKLFKEICGCYPSEFGAAELKK